MKIKKKCNITINSDNLKHSERDEKNGNTTITISKFFFSFSEITYMDRMTSLYHTVNLYQQVI